MVIKAEDLEPGMIIRLSNHVDWGKFANKTFKVLEVLTEDDVDQDEDPGIRDEALEDMGDRYPKGKLGETDFYMLNKCGFTVVVERKVNIPWL